MPAPAMLWTPAEFQTVVAPLREPFTQRPTPEPYDAISGEVRELVLADHDYAMFVPMARYVVDTTLQVLDHESVKARLDEVPEVVDRAAQALMLTHYVMEDSLEADAFFWFYIRNESMQGLHASATELTTPEYLGSLGKVAFLDSQRIAGGALGLLQRSEPDSSELAADVIARSTDLVRTFTGIGKEHATFVFDTLGRPYIDPDALQISSTGNQTEIQVTPPTKDFLEQLKGHGCPAAAVTNPANPGQSLLQSEWERIIRFLVPPHATANATEEVLEII